MRRPYTLITETGSSDTVQCLERLLDESRAGQVIGIAYAVILRRRNYRVNVCGEAHRSPTFTRGVIAALDDELSTRVRNP